jgi:hypothetical protein
MPTDNKKPNGDTSDQGTKYDIQDDARRQGKRASEICRADHSTIRGRECGYCGTYFRGDDMG